MRGGKRRAQCASEIARLYGGCGGRGGVSQIGGDEDQVMDRGRMQVVHDEAWRGGAEPMDVTCAPVTACQACKNAGRGVKHHLVNKCPGFD